MIRRNIRTWYPMYFSILNEKIEKIKCFFLSTSFCSPFYLFLFLSVSFRKRIDEPNKLIFNITTLQCKIAENRFKIECVVKCKTRKNKKKKGFCVVHRSSFANKDVGNKNGMYRKVFSIDSYDWKFRF